jgi:hypothetical protein
LYNIAEQESIRTFSDIGGRILVEDGGEGWDVLVFPAASRPSMRIRISLLAKSLFIILLMEPPMLNGSTRRENPFNFKKATVISGDFVVVRKRGSNS